MKAAFFDVKPYEKEYLEKNCDFELEKSFFLIQLIAIRNLMKKPSIAKYYRFLLLQVYQKKYWKNLKI